MKSQTSALQNHTPHENTLIAYEEYGTGATVLLLHGMAGTAHTHFAPLIKYLAPGYHVIAPDLRRHGASRHLSLPCDEHLYDTYANDVIRLIESLSLERVHLVGYSDGGETALLVAARKCHSVRSVTVWGVSGRVPPPAVVALYADYELRIPNAPAFEAELNTLHGDNSGEEIVRCWVRAMERYTTQCGGIINHHEVPYICCPTTILSGTLDPFNPIAAVRELAKLMPTARLLALSGAGHDLLTERQPQVIAVLQRMLTDYSRS